MKKLTWIFLSCVYCWVAKAQAKDEPVQMADAMRANGKIYVVVAVVVTILVGLFVYLIRLDRKISRLEKGKTVD